MLESDKRINAIVKTMGGMYIRYSDDFIVILPAYNKDNAVATLKEIQDVIDSTPGLTLEPNKTQYFEYDNETLKNCGKMFHADADDSKRFINFLGFAFDGKQVSIRAKTISKYYYRMYRKARNIAKSGYRTHKGNHISCRNLYRIYSERGAHGKRGNFLSYVARAEKIYRDEETITRDTRRHMQKIRKALNGK